MTLSLWILMCIGLTGMLFLMTEIRNAPEGYEDETGFHYTWRNNRPDVSNISCIWASPAGNPPSHDGEGLRRVA